MTSARPASSGHPLKVLVLTSLPTIESYLTKCIRAAQATHADCWANHATLTYASDPVAALHDLQTCDVLFADLRMVAKHLHHAKQMKFLQSTFAGVEPIFNFSTRPRDYVFCRMGRCMLAELSRFRDYLRDVSA
jgi:hypothetical protein